MELSNSIPPGETCQWPNDYPLAGLDRGKPNCDLPAVFRLADHGYFAFVCVGHGITELLGGQQ